MPSSSEAAWTLIEAPQAVINRSNRRLDLVIAGGQGNAHTGVGDPYLPFREILGLEDARFLVHCAAGKDRTGVTAAVLLALAGVSDDVIAADYDGDGIDEFLRPLADVDRRLVEVHRRLAERGRPVK